MTDSTHTLHLRGNHCQCDYLACEERQAEETQSRATLYARAVMASIAKRGGNPEAILGEEYERYVRDAEHRCPSYLPRRPGPAMLIKANMDVREAMAGIPVIWACEEYSEDDEDFDVDAFLDQLT